MSCVFVVVMESTKTGPSGRRRFCAEHCNFSGMKKETALRMECCFFFLEQVTRLELATSTLARWRSTR